MRTVNCNGPLNPPPRSIAFEIPFPPSSNRYWRLAKGRTFVSAEAKAFKAAVRAIEQLSMFVLLTGPVSVEMRFYRPAKRGDLDNRIKVAFDSLNGVVWVDDKQVVEIHAYQFDDKNRPRVDVTVREVE